MKIEGGCYCGAVRYVAEGLPDQGDGRNVDEAPGLVAIGPSGEARRGNLRLKVDAVHPDRGRAAEAELHGALDATYRFYRDTYGTEAHTVDLGGYQRRHQILAR